jgi:DNA-binding response OmpR family regulator
MSAALKQKILIVDDEPEAVELVEFNLKQAGYDVASAVDGAEALKKTRALLPSLIVLDVMLPEMDGLEVCKMLRRDPATAAIPIIMLTAKAAEIDRVLGLELGADDYLTKPFSIRELLARAKAFLRRRQAASSTVFQFGKCKLDLTAHKAFRDGEEIALTTKEFRLLEFFLQRPGRALTRDQILDAVWGNDIVVNDRSVDRCVTTLRAKIESDPHHPVCIQTIRDIGYRFEYS